MPKAPGIYINELDLSQIVSNANDLVLAVVGGATKGPLNIPTVLDTEADQNKFFGLPVSTDLGLLTSLRFLRSGSRVVYLRVADNSVATADRDIPGTSGGTAATKATGTINFTGGVNASDGELVTIHNIVPTANLASDNAGASANVAITLGGAGASGRIAISGMTGGTVSGRAVGQVYFKSSAQPSDGDQIIIGDGSVDGSDPVTFEFDSNSSVTPSSTLRQVVIGANAYATMTNLIAAINTAPTFIVSASDGTVSKIYEFDNNNTRSTAGSVLVAIGASGAITKNNLLVAINNNNPGVVATDTTTTDPQLTITNNVSGTLGNATILETMAAGTATGLSGATDVVGGSNVSVLYAAAISPGTWGNNVQVTVNASTAINAPAGAFDLLVYALVGTSTARTLVEEFVNLNLDSTSARYAQSVINNGVANESNKSNYIVTTVLAANGAPTPGSYLLGAGGGVVGADGIANIASTDIIGNTSGATPTGLKALYDPDAVIFNLLAIPGISHKDVVAEGIALGEARQNLRYFVDPPFGLTPTQWMDWCNGAGVAGVANAPAAALNSTYAVFTAGWVEVYSPDLKTNVWLPPSAIKAAATSRVFRATGFIWNAVAGVVNGIIPDAIALEASPDAATREIIQDTIGGQRVNPILRRVGLGISIEGNRTLYRTNSALAREHVRALLNYLKDAFRAAGLKLQWKAINDTLYSKALNTFGPILEFARTNGAFDTTNGDPGYRLVIDSTVNTANTMAEDRLVVQLAIRPASVAEQIEIDISILKTGATFDIKA